MIEIYLYIKICLDYFPERLKYAELGKPTRLTFLVPVAKVVEVILKYLHPLILHRFTYKTASGFMI